MGKAKRNYQDSAVNVCQSLGTSSHRIQCMDVIVDKLFLEEELRSCSGLSPSSNRVNCLRTTGRTRLGRTVDKQEINSMIKEAIDELHYGSPLNAISILREIEQLTQD